MVCDGRAAELLPRSCDWCPRACGADRRAGERGACGADDTLRIARAALHFWEEPPISGESGSGTVFFSNCSLRCAYCQNFSIARGDVGIAVTVDRLAGIFRELEAQGALNVNLVTPTHYRGQAIAAVASARGEGLSLPIVWNTSGYETVSSIEALSGSVDVYLADCKYAGGERAARYSHAPDYPEVALDAIEAMVEQVGEPVYDDVAEGRRMVRGVIVRHLLLPGGLEDSKEVVRLVHRRFGCAVRLSIMNQYTPVIDTAGEAARRFPELLARVPDGDYEELLDFADEIGVEDYFWQEGGTAEDSFIPAFDGAGVDAPAGPGAGLR